MSHDVHTLRGSERTGCGAHSTTLPSPPQMRPLRQGGVRELDRCDACRAADAPALSPGTGGPLLEPPLPKCAYRPVVLMLQARGSVGLQVDEHGYVVLTVVDTANDAVSVLLNAEELGLLADEIGGVR